MFIDSINRAGCEAAGRDEVVTWSVQGCPLVSYYTVCFWLNHTSTGNKLKVLTMSICSYTNGELLRCRDVLRDSCFNLEKTFLTNLITLYHLNLDLMQGCFSCNYIIYLQLPKALLVRPWTILSTPYQEFIAEVSKLVLRIKFISTLLLLLLVPSPLRRLDDLMEFSDLELADLKISGVEQLYQFLKLSVQGIPIFPLVLFNRHMSSYICCNVQTNFTTGVLLMNNIKY